MTIQITDAQDVIALTKFKYECDAKVDAYRAGLEAGYKMFAQYMVDRQQKREAQAREIANAVADAQQKEEVSCP